jgi:hypothetical protein
MTLRLESPSNRPITIHRWGQPIFSDAIEIREAKTGRLVEIPDWLPNHKYHIPNNLQCLSWHPAANTERPDYLISVHPGEKIEFGFPQSCAGLLLFLWGGMRNGEEYIMRLKGELTLALWTFGEKGALENPRHIDPMPILLDEEVKFVPRGVPDAPDRRNYLF